MSQCPSCGSDNCGGGRGKGCKYKGIGTHMGVQGLVLLARNALDRIEELEKASDFDHAEYKRLLAEFKVDAERYRWISDGEGGCPFAETDPAWDNKTNLDAAIDTARGEK